MSVTYIDPPGPLANTSEPIDFTTSDLVTSISIEFNPAVGNGSRETVWDGTSDVDNSGGDFSYAYRNSTRSGTGPYTWHIVRASGRWPADFRIRVKEELAVDPVLPGYSLLYSKDFATLPNQALAQGANVIDGQRWWFKGALTEANESLALVNGVGLRSRQRTTTPAEYGVGALPACLMLDFADLEGYDPTAPLLVQARFEEVDLTYPSNVRPILSLVTAVGDAAAVTNAERTGLSATMYDFNAGSWRYMFSAPGASGTQTSFGTAGAVNRYVFSILHPVAFRVNLGGATGFLAGDTIWPAVTDSPVHTVNAWRAAVPTGPTPTPSQGLAFWVTNGVGPAFGIVQNSLRALRVYQTGV